MRRLVSPPTTTARSNHPENVVTDHISLDASYTMSTLCIGQGIAASVVLPGVEPTSGMGNLLPPASSDGAPAAMRVDTDRLLRGRVPPHGYYPAKLGPVTPLPPYVWPPKKPCTCRATTACGLPRISRTAPSTLGRSSSTSSGNVPRNSGNEAARKGETGHPDGARELVKEALSL
ncbi:hypothetical protein BV25DRAFT_1922139 [Artomyces pyxidatus]|uniref:Uncharacterized protein n=1 Tax=Artomyces pyxidatus TaxID=48021 RepID=A0ACB8SGM9_9AGAM|nr:hypothetical protein BV25DRAFT_1922139 [Artomyces pyxidatus]